VASRPCLVPPRGRIIDNQAAAMRGRVPMKILSSLLLLATALPVAADIDVLVEANGPRTPISPLIYGINSHGAAVWDPARTPPSFVRIGGNRWTAYNWETNASNAGADWHHQNDGYLVMWVPAERRDLPGEAVRYRLQIIRGAPAAALVTIPMLGHVAADKLADGDVGNTPDYLATRFHPLVVEKAGPLALVPDLTDRAVHADEMVNFVEQSFPDAATDPQRPIFYSMDNEPDLWFDTHARIHPDPVRYDGLVQKSIALASRIKDVAPHARVFGPVNYGFLGLVTLQDAPDAAGRSFVEFFLSEMEAASSLQGRRLLDVLDFHWYPEARGGGVRITADDSSPAVAAARIQAPRSLWDPDYTEDSWITAYLGQPIALLPGLQASIDAHYPGTRMAITEYYYGGGAHISGAVAHADVLGIYGREGVFAANWWQLGNTDHAYIHAAVDSYRNYDGQGGQFGADSVPASTSDTLSSSAYASRASGETGELVLVLINKDFSPQFADLQLAGVSRFGSAAIHALTSAAAEVVAAGSLAPISENRYRYSMPAMSVSTLVFPLLEVDPARIFRDSFEPAAAPRSQDLH
jgi:hypothetical protein